MTTFLDKLTGRKGFDGGFSPAGQYVRDFIEHLPNDLASELDFERSQAEADKLVSSIFNDPIEKARSRFDSLVPSGVEAEWPERTLLGMVNIVTDNTEDRDTDVLETSGAIIDTRMPLLWQHMPTVPIGKMVAVVTHTDTILRVASALLDLNQLTEDAARLIEAGALRISHGFRALEFEDRKGPDGKEPRPGEHFGFRVTKFEVMEESLVSVPSNTSAIIELFSRGKLCDPMIKCWAKSYHDARPTSVPGIDIKDRDTKTATPDPVDQPAHSTDELLAAKRLALTGSWEWVEKHLKGQASRHLELHGVDMSRRFAWLAGTFPGESVVTAEHWDNDHPDEFLFFRVAWEMVDDRPKFTGEPQEVMIQTMASDLGEENEMMDRSPLYECKKTAVRFESTPASTRTTWDGRRGVLALRRWAGVDQDDPSADAWSKYRRGFARVTGSGDKLGDFSFPHHDVADGELRVNRSAVNAGIAIINGARGGANFDSEQERRQVFRHLTRHLETDFNVDREDIPEMRSVDALVAAPEAMEVVAGESFDAQHAMRLFLSHATEEQKARMFAILEAFQEAEESFSTGEAFRQLISA